MFVALSDSCDHKVEVIMVAAQYYPTMKSTKALTRIIYDDDIYLH